jgi:glutaminyl-tRNA synthetase
MSEDKTTPVVPADEAQRNFLEEIIDSDLAAGRVKTVRTRFPPEPNGYLHIGHAKSICLNFGLAKKYGGTCNLRFDDTNPSTEDEEYVNSIKEDVRWLGFQWDNELYASDYFDKIHEWAVTLIRKGLAYIDLRSPEEVSATRGNFYKPGVEAPTRNAGVEENLALFERMRNGEFEEGKCLLRARIDMAHVNMNLRDPLMYRIRKAPHHRTGDKWVIYPMYDWAHGQSDAIEGITHSICTLEFDDHRLLYDWFTRALELPNPPHQYEFARLNLTYTVMSKRKLLELVKERLVDGWDDPRMPTISGLRRRGCPPEAIRAFCDRIGVAKNESTVDVGLLEWALREDLNARCPRVMAVLNPLKVVLTNFPEGRVDQYDAAYFPDEPQRGTRKVPFTRELYIERDDFREEAPKGWHRLAPGSEVRLRYAALVRCQEVIRDASGQVVELRCTWDPQSAGGNAADGRKVRGTIHWVSAAHALPAEVRLYDRLFNVENPLDVPEGHDYKEHLNPGSLTVLKDCLLEPSLATAEPGAHLQFERLGYFFVDPKLSRPGAPVFNRTVTLKDTWARLEQKLGAPATTPVAPALEPGSTLHPRREPQKAEVEFADFARLDLRVGLIVEASLVEGSDKLLRLKVDLGEGRLRQVFSGIRGSYPDPAVLVGRRVPVVANLKPRKMRFGVSEGMILAGFHPEGEHEVLCVPSFDVSLLPGDCVE